MKRSLNALAFANACDVLRQVPNFKASLTSLHAGQILHAKAFYSLQDLFAGPPDPVCNDEAIQKDHI